MMSKFCAPRPPRIGGALHIKTPHSGEKKCEQDTRKRVHTPIYSLKSGRAEVKLSSDKAEDRALDERGNLHVKGEGGWRLRPADGQETLSGSLHRGALPILKVSSAKRGV